MKSFHPISFLLITFSLTDIPVFANAVLSVEEAAKKGFVKLFIKSKGGYTGEVIEMKIQNLTSQKLDLRVEAGRRLDSKEQKEQDILVTKEQEFFVNANQTKSINIFGMCCQAHNNAPTVKHDYLIGKLADSSLIKLAMFIDKNKYYSNYSAQQAVWVVSDDNSIGSIDDGDKEVKNNLRTFVSKLTGKTIPPYDVKYQSGNDGSAMGRAVSIEGVFDYSLPIACHSTMAIYNERGEVVQLIFENLQSDRGQYKHYYTFRIKDLPQGTYYARVNADGMLQKEMKIVF
ncbi:MAG: hypothetical protein IPP64_10775 [Bacteroidetes bacterium]|nr:hypothetical protein [Bacteroidota bacterium]